MDDYLHTLSRSIYYSSKGTKQEIGWEAGIRFDRFQQTSDDGD